MPLVLSLMIKRIIDISERAYVHLKNQHLVIEKQSEIAGQVLIFLWWKAPTLLRNITDWGKLHPA